ncbi:uncharacterized protein LOC132196651 [Neocloeon triangulifer]|uniref:uncharacterized protein LOC132196651 n=1 Tax=Neocloeon triangulifer TaxID=2078957 RepID=UPI00286EBF95|nr:uncharacterized protein LOC132196651 [Neocloeon triangulifer]
MARSCGVSHCRNNKVKHPNKRFFRIPRVISHRGTQDELLTTRRRMAWITVLTRTRNDLTQKRLDNTDICEDHFVSGKPAHFKKVCDVDWAPSVRLFNNPDDEKKTSIIGEKLLTQLEQRVKALTENNKGVDSEENVDKEEEDENYLRDTETDEEGLNSSGDKEMPLEEKHENQLGLDKEVIKENKEVVPDSTCPDPEENDENRPDAISKMEVEKVETNSDNTFKEPLPLKKQKKVVQTKKKQSSRSSERNRVWSNFFKNTIFCLDLEITSTVDFD